MSPSGAEKHRGVLWGMFTEVCVSVILVYMTVLLYVPQVISAATDITV